MRAACLGHANLSTTSVYLKANRFTLDKVNTWRQGSSNPRIRGSAMLRHARYFVGAKRFSSASQCCTRMSAGEASRLRAL